ncbi:IS200/IS605 family transposase, partial [Christensenellaceae bacterium OttesenSCG-928-L17]|nr:IS200/IS605 family transposase [Christensenellaceae bacterium OttesenSCG-928-L17]
MAQSLAHTKWLCKYHIVFTPKYRRKIIYRDLRKDIQDIIRDLCKWKGVEILEGHMKTLSRVVPGNQSSL